MTQVSGEYVISGRVAVVVGASGAIGSAVAKRLAEQGATVVAGYNRAHEQAERLVAALPGHGHSIVRLSMEDSSAIAAAARFVAEKKGRCDILINAAGMTYAIAHGDLAALTDDRLDQIYRVNMRGPFVLMREFVSLLKASGNAVVINVSSTSSINGMGSNIAYCAAKAATDTMNLSLARVLGPEIRIIGISPGGVDTDFVPGRDRQAFEKRALAAPLKKVMSADDVAVSIIGAIRFFPLATGTNFVVDGGRHLC